ncbi:MAG: hypothetical protein LBC27_01265 [Spirochaetaceae bacterium]|nr:hypothetical protein [Spirochaetaceae bacterium]
MPAADVVISATFSQIPVKSNFLAELGVSVPAVITPPLSNELNYTALIPHIAEVAPAEPENDSNNWDNQEIDDGSADMTFAIIAVPEDPSAELKITEYGNEDDITANSAAIPLVEGKKKYVITVSREELDDKVYNFTVSYEPDLSLKSITLTSSDAEGWEQPLPVHDTQTVNIPYYSSVTIDALPSDNEAAAILSLKSGSGDIVGTGENTLSIPASPSPTDTVTLVVGITVKKTVGDSDYEKTYLLNIKRAPFDANYPTAYRATGGGINVIKNENGTYDEIHIFTSDDSLVFNESENEVEAWVLVVAGGGGGGGAAYPSGGGGAGGMIETLDATSEGHYTYSLIGTLAYSVTVGLGGEGGKSTKKGDVDCYDGNDGVNSTFGEDFIAIGGGGGAKQRSYNTNNPGRQGGSSGGGASSHPALPGTYPVDKAASYGNAGGAIATDYNYAAGGGGAGGPGQGGTTDNTDWATGRARGGAGRVSNITGEEVTYSKGGGTAPHIYTWPPAEAGTPYTGNGGAGAWNERGGKGGSGIVIVRFPAKLPAQEEQ